MTAVVLRDVVARVTLDPLFALQVRTNPPRFAASVNLTASEANTLAALLRPVQQARAIGLRSDLARHVANEAVLMDRVRDLLARNQPATGTSTPVTAADLESRGRVQGESSCLHAPVDCTCECGPASRAVGPRSAQIERWSGSGCRFAGQVGLPEVGSEDLVLDVSGRDGPFE